MTMKKIVCLQVLSLIFVIGCNMAMAKRKSKFKSKLKSIRHKLHNRRELIYIPEVLEMQKRAPLGRRSHPAKSCRDIFQEVPNAKSGVYWFDIVDQNNKTKQVQFYCKKGDYFEEPNGTYPPENLNAGKAKAEPYDWEELHRETWPSPIDPPDSETMDKKIKEALKEIKPHEPWSHPDETSGNITNRDHSEHKDPINVNISHIINNDKPAKSNGIKIVHAKPNKNGKRSTIRIKVLKMRKITSFASKRGELAYTHAKNGSGINLPTKGSKSNVDIRKPFHAKIANHSESERGQVLKPSGTPMDGTVVKEVSATAGLTDLPQASARNDAADDEIQSSVILELNRKSKIALTSTDNISPRDGIKKGLGNAAHTSEGRNIISPIVAPSVNGQDQVLNETQPPKDVKSNAEPQPVPVNQSNISSVSSNGQDLENNIAAGSNATGHKETMDNDQLQHQNWPDHINDVLKKLQINVSEDKLPVHGEPLTFRPGNGSSVENTDGPDYISNSTWPNEVSDVVANATRDLMKQADLAKEYGSAEDFFSRLLSGEDGIINMPDSIQSSNNTEDYAAQLYGADDEPANAINNATLWNYNSTKGLTIAESTSSWNNMETNGITSKEINDALNAIPYASYQTRIKRQLDHM